MRLSRLSSLLFSLTIACCLQALVGAAPAQAQDGDRTARGRGGSERGGERERGSADRAGGERSERGGGSRDTGPGNSGPTGPGPKDAGATPGADPGSAPKVAGDKAGGDKAAGGAGAGGTNGASGAPAKPTALDELMNKPRKGGSSLVGDPLFGSGGGIRTIRYGRVGRDYNN